MKSNPEQREKTRFRHVSDIIYEELDAGRYVKSRMYNYSQEGFYFESDLKLDAGETILVGIKNSPYVESFGTYECYAVEIQWRKVPETSPFKYAYGVRFAAGKTESTGDKTVDPQPGPAGERRKYLRKNIEKDIRYFARQRVFDGRLKNIAPNGAFLETTQLFAVGQKLSLILPFLSRKNISPLVKAEVIWKNEKGIGVKFLRIKKAPA